MGIEAFYTTPKQPEYPTSLQYQGKEPTAEQLKLQVDHDQQMKDWSKVNSTHSRNTSMIAVVASVLILILSLTILHKIDIMSNGFLFGGLLTLGYAIIRGFGSDNSKYRFLLVSVGLAIVLALGYIKFIKPKEGLKQ